MLNIGLIGNTEILEPFVKRLRENKNINVIGKASVGTSSQLNSFHFSIPEFNRVELIERADVIIMDNSSLLPFKILTEIVKKSKHVFTAGYLNLTIDECTQIVKLANESGSVIQVSNPYFFTPAIQWLNNNISSPVYLDVLDFTDSNNNDNLLYPIILMLLEITSISPKKVGAVTFNSNPNKSDFTNVRLEFGDASVVNISFGTLESLEEFKIRVYSRNQFITLNFTRNNYVCNNNPIDLSGFETINEIDYFVDTIQNKTRKKSCLEDYLIAMYLVQKINKKITQFFAQ
jgi:predicted dehydrogenase